MALADEECLRLWDNLSCGYTETQGLPILRKECAKMINEDMCSSIDKPVSADDILMFAGGEEGIFTTIKTLLSEKDHAIIISPCYQSVKSVTETVCSLTLFDLNPHNSWNLDVAKLETLIQPSITKMIMINFPNNPTGATISRETQQALVNLAKKYDLWIFSDEIYFGVDRMEEPSYCMATMYDKAVSLGGVSKSFGLAGLRIGWICTRHHELMHELAGSKHYLSICNSAPSEILSLIAVRERKTIWKRQKDIITNNLHVLREFLSSHSELFQWCEPVGGCCGFMKVLIPSVDLEELAEVLAQETGLLILPGNNFPCTPEYRGEFDSYMRIGFGRRNFPESLALLKELIPKYFLNQVSN